MSFSWNTPISGPPPGQPVPDDRRALLVLLVAALFGAALVAVATARPDRELPVCACGHDARAHEHVKPGTHCGICKPWKTVEPCLRYEPVARPGDPRPSDEAAAHEFLRVLREPVLAH